MAKFMFSELVNTNTFTARLGAGTGAGNNVSDTERGKWAKLVGDSRYDLAALGDELENRIDNINVGTQDGYTIAGLQEHIGPGKFIKATSDGLQATPGTGTLAIGDYVLVGTVVAKGTALTEPARVVKATTQATAKATPNAWRVAGLGTAGTGVAGTTILIMHVGV